MKRRKKSNRLVLAKVRPQLAFSVESRIFLLRGQRVILDTDLAELYAVPVRQLNQQIKRNRARFPEDFVFRLTTKEKENLRSQIVISSSKHGGTRYLPHAFTEHGAIMAATVLNSEKAVHMSVFVVRAFVRLRKALAANWKLAGKIEELEKRIDAHDDVIHDIFAEIKQLMQPKPVHRRKIGFQFPGPEPEGLGSRRFAV